MLHTLKYTVHDLLITCQYLFIGIGGLSFLKWMLTVMMDQETLCWKAKKNVNPILLGY